MLRGCINKRLCIFHYKLECNKQDTLHDILSQMHTQGRLYKILQLAASGASNFYFFESGKYYMEIPDAESLCTNKHKRVTDSKLYTVVLERCVEKIVYTSTTSDKTFTIFDVPMFMIGVPLYNTTSCIMFLINELSRKNYITRFIEPIHLHIDWGKKTNFNKNSEYIKKLLEKHPNTKIDFVYE